MDISAALDNFLKSHEDINGSVRATWDACRNACADICKEHSLAYVANRSFNLYTAFECGKVCEKLEQAIRPKGDDYV